MKQVFITGSDGFIGAEVALQFMQMGFDVSTADAKSGTDIRDREIMKQIPEGVDAIVHLAAFSSDTMCKDNAYKCFDVNVLGTLNMMEAALARKAKQFIFASTEWVYDSCTADEEKNEESFINIANHTSEYALSKLVSEGNLRQKYAHGFMSVTIVRFGIVCGTTGEKRSAVESLFMNVRNKDVVEVGSLRTGRCFIHVSDLVAGIVKTVGLEGLTIINLAGDRVVTLSEIIETSKTVLKKSPRVVEKNPESVSVRNISNKKAKELLGWQPVMSVGAWLKQLSQTT